MKFYTLFTLVLLGLVIMGCSENPASSSNTESTTLDSVGRTKSSQSYDSLERLISIAHYSYDASGNSQSSRYWILNPVTQDTTRRYVYAHSYPTPLVTDQYDSADGAQTGRSHAEYIMNGTKKLMVNTSVWNKKDSLYYKVTKEYDSQGRVILETTLFGDTTRWVWYEASRCSIAYSRMYPYVRINKTLDAAGHEVAYERWTHDTLQSRSTTRYENGNLVFTEHEGLFGRSRTHSKTEAIFIGNLRQSGKGFNVIGADSTYGENQSYYHDGVLDSTISFEDKTGKLRKNYRMIQTYPAPKTTAVTRYVDGRLESKTVTEMY